MSAARAQSTEIKPTRCFTTWQLRLCSLMLRFLKMHRHPSLDEKSNQCLEQLLVYSIFFRLRIKNIGLS